MVYYPKETGSIVWLYEFLHYKKKPTTLENMSSIFTAHSLVVNPDEMVPILDLLDRLRKNPRNDSAYLEVPVEYKSIFVNALKRIRLGRPPAPTSVRKLLPLNEQIKRPSVLPKPKPTPVDPLVSFLGDPFSEYYRDQRMGQLFANILSGQPTGIVSEAEKEIIDRVAKDPSLLRQVRHAVYLRQRDIKLRAKGLKLAEKIRAPRDAGPQPYTVAEFLRFKQLLHFTNANRKRMREAYQRRRGR